MPSRYVVAIAPRRARRSPLDAYSGLPVLFGDAGQTVVERIRAHLREARAS